MSDSENQQTSAKAIGNEKFSDPKWRKLFTVYPAYKELFEKDNKLTALFEPHPEWAEAFASNPRWFEFLDVDIKVAEFFRHQPIGNQQVQFWHNQGWFDRIAKKLTKNEIPKWIKQFEENDELTELFKEKPAWALFDSFIKIEKKYKYVNKEKIGNVVKQFKGDNFKQEAQLAQLFFNVPEWIVLFINHDKVLTFFNKYPNWAGFMLPFPKWINEFEKDNKLTEKLDNDGQWGKSLHQNQDWLKLFARKPELFLKKQEWFDQIAKKLEASKGQIWINKMVKDEQWLETFDKSPEWVLANTFELQWVNKRRKQDETSNNNKNLVGLAFSGGGIRSASFSLGVLEALRDFGLLKKIDYLSTVSGGGYIGAWLSANCKRAPENSENRVTDWLVADAKTKEEWNNSIRHLRRYSNYLSPKVGLFSADTWTMVAVWLRNTLLIQLTVILGIAVLLLLPRLLFSFFRWFTTVGEGWVSLMTLITSGLCILSVAGIAGNNWQVLNGGKDSSLDSKNWLYLSLGALICGLIGLLIAQLCKFNPLLENPIDFLGIFIAFVIAVLMVFAGFGFISGAKKVIDASHPERKFDYSQWGVQRGVVLPMMAVGFFVAAILWKQSISSALKEGDSFGYYLWNAWQYWPFPLTVVVVSLFFLSFCCVRNRNSQEQSLDKVITPVIVISAPIIATISLYALISAIMLLLHGWIDLGTGGKWLTFVWTPPLVLFAFSLAILMLLGILGRDTTEGVREWWSRMGAWLAIYGFAWMVIVAVAVYGPLWSAILYYDGPWKELGSGWIGTTLAGLFAGKSAGTSGADGKGVSTKLKEAIAKLAPFVFIAGLLIAVSMILHLVIAINSNDTFDMSRSSLLGYPWQSSVQSAHWDLLSNAGNWSVFWIFVSCLVFVIVLALRVDINEFSFNAFYRSRLARCFLGATRQQAKRDPQNFTGFDDNDDLDLSELADSCGPLHIVNCALNLGGSSDLALHTRHSAIFTMTPFFCGSRYQIKGENLSESGMEIGYTPTNAYGGESGQPTLGQAIAVSGAAANPNMGYHTSPVTAFLMTLFNVRLGWWFPNPHKPDIKFPSPGIGVKYWVKELFGSADECLDFLSISDGGHFENLAAYELVKRKCKVIIISDGECDPNYQFEGLGTLIRMCEVDFGAKIKIDVSSILLDKESHWSRSRCAVGKIIYDDKSKGTLIYMKASMNGHEDTDILQYKAAHTDFPHETTGDQFYGEDQFESYRNLGCDITKRTFDPIMREVDPETGRYTKNLKEPDLIKCAEKLRDIWSPMLPTIEQFSRHADRLMKLWSEIREDESLKSLDNQLTNDVYKSGDEKFRSEFYFCSELIQQMENVYLDLNFEETWEHPDNKGWRTLFTRWANSETLKEIWRATDTNYGLRFRYFCERHLFREPPHKE